MVLLDKLMITVRRIAECRISKCLLSRGKREQRCSECERNIFFEGRGVIIIVKIIALLAKKKSKRLSTESTASLFGLFVLGYLYTSTVNFMYGIRKN